MRLKLIYTIFFILIVVFLFNKCRQLDVCPSDAGYFNIKGFELKHNASEEDTILSFFDFQIIINPLLSEVFLNENYCRIHQNTVKSIDYFKIINVTTLNYYNSGHNANESLNNILSVKYYVLHIYNKGLPEDANFSPTGETGINYYIDSLYVKNIYPINQYDNISLFLTEEKPSRAHRLDLRLTEPPDSATIFQLKIDIELLDDRNFELISSPVYIKP